MKSASDFMAEANAVVPRIASEEAIKIHASGKGVFIDVRDGTLVAKTGTIADAHHIARGMFEFNADSDHPLHNPILKKDAAIYLVCGAGGQAALAGKTLIDMGFSNVTNIGGFADWKSAGGPTQN